MNKIAAKESLVDLIMNAFATGKPFFSVEFIPGTTPHLKSSLEESLKAFVARPPLFASVTWHNSHKTIGGTSESEIDHPALQLADELQNKHNITTCLHLAAGDLSKDQVSSILNRAFGMGVTSVLALRGDTKTTPSCDFHTGADVVRFIREKFGSKFTVAVAGYPSTGHSENTYQTGLLDLKDKVVAGADFIITQVIFRAKDFLTFAEDCQRLGINVPIIPGLLVTEMHPSLASLERMALLTKIALPPEITEQVNSLQSDPTAQGDYVQNLSFRIAQQLVDSNKIPGIHFFTINRGSQTLKIWDKINCTAI